jgi:hypothetical protein
MIHQIFSLTRVGVNILYSNALSSVYAPVASKLLCDCWYRVRFDVRDRCPEENASRFSPFFILKV